MSAGYVEKKGPRRQCPGPYGGAADRVQPRAREGAHAGLLVESRGLGRTERAAGPYFEADPGRQPGPVVSDPDHPFVPNGAACSRPFASPILPIRT